MEALKSKTESYNEDTLENNEDLHRRRKRHPVRLVLTPPPPSYPSPLPPRPNASGSPEPQESRESSSPPGPGFNNGRGSATPVENARPHRFGTLDSFFPNVYRAHVTAPLLMRCPITSYYASDYDAYDCLRRALLPGAERPRPECFRSLSPCCPKRFEERRLTATMRQIR
ncbi:hypothetical protein CPC08DRAFT_749750 [Agrocybe pediades]|nr:hypothetical protein CPC08DRAFT_749750 [Agrocybe pediades]